MAAQRGCTQCGNCVDTCPAYALHKREEYSPKAKQELVEQGWKEDSGLDWEKMMDLAGRCVCCERCLSACPRKLSVPEVLSKARARHPRWQQYFWREWIQRGTFLWSVAARMAPLAPRPLLPQRLKVLHAAALAMKKSPDTLAWLVLAPNSPKTAKGFASVLFGGCTATRLRPQWMGKSTRTLQKLGAAVCPSAGFGCCGGTFEHAGMPVSAHKAARRNLEHWRNLGKPKVVTICASCLHSLRHYAHMDGLLSEDEARQWTASLLPLSSFLPEATVVVTDHAPQRPAYHSPCHWGTQDTDWAWLHTVLPGLHKGSSLCCGFGGVFKMLEPLLSRDMAENCWKGLLEPKQSGEGGEGLEVLTGCSGCAMQLAAHAPKAGRIHHWLDVWQPQ